MPGLGLALVASAAFGAADGASRATKPPRLIRVPLTRQATDYTCGAAALQSVLGYFGEDLGEGELAAELKSNPRDGTDYPEMVKAARARGVRVELRKGASLADLKAALDEGRPAIVSIQAWSDRPVDYAKTWENGHYVVAVGHGGGRLYFMDPSILGRYGFLPEAAFLARWHDEEAGGERVSGLMLAFSKPKAKTGGEAFRPIE